MPHFDICIIGSGSANTLPDRQLAGLRIALVEGGTFGGTCLNVGCIPTKMLVHPADLANSPGHAADLGVDLRLDRVRWVDLRDRIFNRIDKLSAEGEQHRAVSSRITLYRDWAAFVGPRRLQLAGGEVVTADRFVIGAGSRPTVPDLPGLAAVPFHTSDTVMRVDRLPASMLIIGGGYVAAEFAHIFASFGVQVTLVNRSELLLRREDREVAERFTGLLGRRVTVHLNHRVDRLERQGEQVVVHLVDGAGRPRHCQAELLLLATGRTPNGDRLNLPAAGVEVDDAGLVVVDEFQRTTAEGVFALGDVSTAHPYKHVANHEARVVKHNLLHPATMVRSDHRFVPHAVFSDPQVAAVGLTEEEARARQLPHVVGRADYAVTGYGWAMEDTEHFVKLLADPATGLLLGAHVLGPEASSLIQPLIQAMSFGLGAREMARGQYWIHPAMVEVVENALLDLPLDR